MFKSTDQRTGIVRLARPMAAVASLVLFGASAATFGADAPDGQPPQGQAQGQGQGQGNRGRGGFNREEMQKRMEDRLKEMLGAKDEEWTALQPRIEQVVKLQRQLQGRGMAALFRRGGPNGQNGGGQGADAARPEGGRGGGLFGEQTGPVADAGKDLQDTLDKKDASVDEVKAKLAALRDARTKVKGDLTKAQDDLKGLLTPQQEAALVELGILE